SLSLVRQSGGRTGLEAEGGRGTYVRALARDLGRARGWLGHVSALRRTRVGPFTEEDAVTVVELQSAVQDSDGAGVLRPVETALAELPSLAVSRDMAGRLMRGQSIILRVRD